jgi:hypothetical protein
MIIQRENKRKIQFIQEEEAFNHLKENIMTIKCNK